MSRKVTGNRTMRHGTASALEAADSTTSMADLIREEERKRAGGHPPDPDAGRTKGGRESDAKPS